MHPHITRVNIGTWNYNPWPPVWQHFLSLAESTLSLSDVVYILQVLSPKSVAIQFYLFFFFFRSCLRSLRNRLEYQKMSLYINQSQRRARILGFSPWLISLPSGWQNPGETQVSTSEVYLGKIQRNSRILSILQKLRIDKERPEGALKSTLEFHFLWEYSDPYSPKGFHWEIAAWKNPPFWQAAESQSFLRISPPCENKAEKHWCPLHWDPFLSTTNTQLIYTRVGFLSVNIVRYNLSGIRVLFLPHETE